MAILWREILVLLALNCLFNSLVICQAYIPCGRTFNGRNNLCQKRGKSNELLRLFANYVPQVEKSTAKQKKKSLHPNAGDFIRYYDIDGGKSNGEVLVGKIAFIQKDIGKENSYLVEITEMEDVGDGYYAEYPARKRNSKKTTRKLEDVSPVFASFVRNEAAFKLPRKAGTDEIQVRAESYDLDDYTGPYIEIDDNIVQQDKEIYSTLKTKLLKNAALTGVAGALITDLIKGTEDAIIYGLGALGSVAYLALLTLKTDTVGSGEAKIAKNISNLRFFMPLLVIVAVALYNQSLGDANPMYGSDSPFKQVTSEQFTVAIIGFLTYRLPLFIGQIQDAFKSGSDDDETLVPGSAGIAMSLVKGSSKSSSETAGVTTIDAPSLPSVLVISGPQATGRAQLVKSFISQGEGKFVEPQKIDRIQDGATFDRLLQRDEFLDLGGPNDRYGLTKQGILDATAAATEDRQKSGKESVVIIDANVELVKKLIDIPGIRIIGVWIGLGSVKEFESKLKSMIQTGELAIPEDETEQSVIRSRIKEIVQEIEYGITSGVFEFTILNENEEQSLVEIQKAAKYCFT